MSYASVMVPVDLGPAAVPRIKLAGGLAGRFGAVLIGVAALSVVEAQLIEDDGRPAGESLIEAEAVFQRLAGGRSRVEWRSAISEPSSFLAEQARAADLVVLNRPDPTIARGWTSTVAPGDFLLASGRPVLVAPPQVDTLSARCIIVGWKDTREARRAVRDSLPLLATAEEVFVIAVGTETPLESAQDVAEYLARHRVESTRTLKLEADGTIAEEILDTAVRFGADLVVSGAYGRSRLREWTFGGVTRELLDHAPVCCLLSH